MSSTLIVSDKTITPALATTLRSPQHAPCGDLNQISDPATRTYWSRHENTEEANDAVAERNSQRLLREAFKKTMTVQSPLLTSTSSGMVLDLTPGPTLESRWKEVETGKRSSFRLETSATVAADGSIEDERRRRQVSANSKVLSEPESSSSESSHSDRGTSMDMSDAEDKSLDKNDEEEEEEEEEHDGDDHNSSSNKDLGTHIKVEALDDDDAQPQHAIAISSSGKGSASTDSRADDLVLEPTTQHQEALARSLCVMNARSKSTSSVPSASSSPVLPRVPTRPPSAPLPALSGHETVMTAQDIAFRTASLGALTPIEIQRRMYEHSHPKLSSSRWPTRRRRSAGVSLEGRSQGDSFLSSSSSSLQMQPTPLPLRKRQASAGMAAAAAAGSVSDGIIVSGGGRDRPPHPHASFAPALPSYYYLPPSAFRTAAAAAAEEQQEAEHRRKKEQEQKEKEENSFFDFPSPSPSPSPPPQASPSC
ncbi:hypothetical protein BGZ70_009842 [Mortierella alpina]|uniref:Uncharacterized protein n=1 Tax=Mortierella alpina TaxID=64518 RepID=A0A9P6J0L9_MORAP|nr:hypothetical protein BGZ70_009842 [Mortierella alpina]